MQGKVMERNRWVAAALSLAMPGLGQVYNGEPVKAMSFFVVFILVPLAGFRFSAYLPGGWLIAGVIAASSAQLAVYAFSVAEAHGSARRLEREYALRPFNRWYFYAAAWMLGAFLITAAGNRTRDESLQAFKIPTGSMEPAVLRGDHILLDKTAYRRMPPEIGDIVVFVFPDDRSRFFIGRLKGLPGDMVELDGKKETVPHGSVFVLKDKSEDTVDSRDFGFVPLRDVIGKVRQVYFSLGPRGIRWGRVGLTPANPPQVQ